MFMQSVIEKIMPAATQAVQRKDSGHFEIHFNVGKFVKAKQFVTL